MEIIVTTSEVKISEENNLNQGEVNVHKVHFSFLKEYDGYTKFARFFVLDKKIDVEIDNDGFCDIPNEATKYKYEIRIGVFAEKVDDDGKLHRWSPEPTKKFVLDGSYDGEGTNTEELTPTDKQQMNSRIQKNTDDISELKTNKQDKLIEGNNIHIDDHNVISATDTIYDDTEVKQSIQNLENEKVDKIEGKGLSTNDLTDELKQTYDNKVDKIPGKGLSTNDYTNDEKEKLSSLNNYDDTEVRRDIEILQEEQTTQNTNISNNASAISAETTNRENADLNLQNQIDAITSSSDVVDVVGTYSELQNYDTSSLTDDDVIKVLQDSTHNNALSYYRWVISDSTGIWNYVGSEGPFYTKGEADALLNGKQNKIDSEHKLSSDLVDDSTSSNKFVTNDEKETWNNKSDFSGKYNDLSNKPDLSVYEEKSNKVSSISSSSTDTEYPNAKCMYDSQKAQDKIITNNSEKIERAKMIYNAMPKATATGTEFTLDGTAKCPMYESNVGATEVYQETTTGKNLFDKDNQTKIQVSADGIFRYGLIVDAPNEKVSISGKNWKSYIVYKPLTNGEYGQWVNINNDSTINVTDKLIIYSNSNTAKLDADVDDLQIEIGDITSYEPYTGNKPSPSPDYPQEIHVINGDNEVKVDNKQKIILTNGTYTSDGVTVVVNNGAITMSGTATGSASIIEMPLVKPIEIKANTTYKIAINNQTTLPGAGCYLFVNDDINKRTTFRNQNAELTLNETTDLTITKLSIRIAVNNTANLVINPVLNYDAYQRQTYSITLPSGMELCKIGDYEDEFFKNVVGSKYYDSTLELNKWYLKKRIGKTTDTIGSTSKTISDMVSNATVYSYCGGTVSGTTITYTSALVVANYIYYPTTTPTNILLNNTLQQQLDDIQKAISYQGQTNISQENNDLPFTLKFSAIRDLSGIFELIAAE